MDFVDFQLRDPDEPTHQCRNDRLIIAGSSTVPVICGNNQGAHSDNFHNNMLLCHYLIIICSLVYLDSGSKGSMTSVTVVTIGDFNRLYQIKVAQIPCAANYRGNYIKNGIKLIVNRKTFVAWEGCLQYHDSVSGTINSFNFNSGLGLQLSNQDYSICIRNQRGFCSISYTG